MFNPRGTKVSGLIGGCFCGAIRYEARGVPFQQTVCHCRMCRRSAGAPMVAWFSVKPADFKITAGQPSQYRSSGSAVRSFRPLCGTQLTFKQDRLDEIDVTVCSLDDPEAVAPRDHTYVASRLRWLHLDDGLPQYAQARP